MIPTRYTLNLINNDLLANALLWNDDPATRVGLVKSSFVPSPDLQMTDITMASFTGGEDILVPAPPQLAILDNDSGRVGIIMKEPVGGYRWICSVAPDPAETIYGWIVYDTDDQRIFFSELLPAPVVIAAVGNVVEITAVLGYLSMGAYGNLDDLV